MTRTPTSLRQRLVLGALALGLLFAVLFGVLASWRVHHAEDQAIRAALDSRLELARDEVTSTGLIRQDAGSPKTDLIQVLAPDGGVRSRSAALSRAGSLVDVDAVIAAGRGVQTRVALQHPDADLAVLAVPLRMTRTRQHPGGTGALVVATDTEGFTSTTSDLVGVLLTGVVGVVVALTLLAWWLTGRALSSVTRITENAEGVRPGDLAAGLPVPRRDVELARLVEALNRMLSRLHASHTAELAFAGEAGHRLRTPVATLRAEAELALQLDEPHDLRAAMVRMIDDADQLGSIVNSMLARTRPRDLRAPRPVLTSVNEAAPRWHRQAALSGVDMTVRTRTAINGATTCRDLIEVVEPIVDNAVRHTPAGGTVEVLVDLADDGRTLRVLVSNAGDEVPPELASRLFDAWVSGRNASRAGGLGLWLARETARDNGGEVVLRPYHDGSTTFEVQLDVVSSGRSRRARGSLEPDGRTRAAVLNPGST